MTEFEDKINKTTTDLIRHKDGMVGRTVAYHLEPVVDNVRNCLSTLQQQMQQQMQQMQAQLADLTRKVDQQAMMSSPLDFIQQMKAVTEVVATLKSQLSGLDLNRLPPAGADVSARPPTSCESPLCSGIREPT